MKHKKTTKSDAQRMQGAFDKNGSNQEAKARVMSAGDKHAKAQQSKSKKSK